MEVVSDEEAFLFGMELAGVSAVSMVLKSALELGILETIAKAGPGAYLCPSHIAAEIPTIKNPHAPSMLDRMLRLLASYNIHTPSINCLMVRLKGTMVFTQKPNTLSNEDGVSVAAYFLMEHDKVLKRHVVPLADSVKEGGHPSSNAYGMTAFEFHDTNPRFNNLFNKGLSDISSITMKKILEIYNGFEGVGSVVDVGGGTGAIINMVAYPTTKCLNFDLPHVIKEAPAYTGVEHIGGDMFVCVPKGDVIFMKWVCHD